MGKEYRIAWQPQHGPQLDAITATWCDELFFGGARGGGKTDYLLGDYAQDYLEFGSAWRGVLFRESYPELEEVVQRGREMFYPLGAVYKEQAKTFEFPNGAYLKMRYIEREADADKYQGHQYTWIGWDELPKQKSFKAYHKIKATLRSAHDVPVKRIRSSGNPCGTLHNEIKAYFHIDKYPQGYKIIECEDTKTTRLFIPSKVYDNKILLEQDPGYIDRLKGVGNEQLVKAWLDGDWDAIEGAFFDCWSAKKHVIRPFSLPSSIVRFSSFDWGSAKPFSHGWWAVSDGIEHPDGFWIPQGAMIRYREWYGAKGADEGLKLTVEQVASGIKERESVGEKITYRVADPAIFTADGGPSFAERFARCGVHFRRADNRRVSNLKDGKGPLIGWDSVRARMIGEEDRPMIYCFSTCVDSIRTIPVLQHDPDKPEDLDTNGEDHAADEWRYACMSRPFMRSRPKDKPLVDTRLPTMEEVTRDFLKRQKLKGKDKRI